jgi:hypothetical protein
MAEYLIYDIMVDCMTDDCSMKNIERQLEFVTRMKELNKTLKLHDTQDIENALELLEGLKAEQEYSQTPKKKFKPHWKDRVQRTLRDLWDFIRGMG